MHDNHLDDSDLLLFDSRELSLSEAESPLEHLRTCAECKEIGWATRKSSERLLMRLGDGASYKSAVIVAATALVIVVYGVATRY